MVAGRAGAGGDIDSDGEVEKKLKQSKTIINKPAAAATITITNARKKSDGETSWRNLA